MKGHPVFVAQHATATCCRECIRKWHKMQPGKELSHLQQDYLVDVIMTWIQKEIERQEGNVIMSEGLVLQDVDVWYDSTKIHTTPHNNMTELYFEDNDIEGIIEKLESGKYVVSYVTDLMELEGGQKLVRFYDPSGNLIEVRTPVNYS